MGWPPFKKNPCVVFEFTLPIFRILCSTTDMARLKCKIVSLYISLSECNRGTTPKLHIWIKYNDRAGKCNKYM